MSRGCNNPIHSELLADNEKLSAKIEDLQKEVNQSQNLNEKLVKLEDELNNYKNLSNKQRQDLLKMAEYQEESHNLSERLANLENELKNYKDLSSKQSQELLNMKRDKEELIKEKDAFIAQLAQLRNDNEEQIKILQTQNLENQKIFRTKIAEYATNLKSAHTECQRLTSEAKSKEEAFNMEKEKLVQDFQKSKNDMEEAHRTKIEEDNTTHDSVKANLEAALLSWQSEVSTLLNKLKEFKAVEIDESAATSNSELKQEAIAAEFFNRIKINKYGGQFLPFLKKVRNSFSEPSTLEEDDIEGIKNEILDIAKRCTELFEPEIPHLLEGRRVILMRLNHNPFLFVAVLSPLLGSNEKRVFVCEFDQNSPWSKYQLVTATIDKVSQDQGPQKAKLEKWLNSGRAAIINLTLKQDIRPLALTLSPKAQSNNLFAKVQNHQCHNNENNQTRRIENKESNQPINHTRAPIKVVEVLEAQPAQIKKADKPSKGIKILSSS